MWILIMTIALGKGGGYGVGTIATQEFTSAERCGVAGKLWLDEIKPKITYGMVVSAACVQK